MNLREMLGNILSDNQTHLAQIPEVVHKPNKVKQCDIESLLAEALRKNSELPVNIFCRGDENTFTIGLVNGDVSKPESFHSCQCYFITYNNGVLNAITFLDACNNIAGLPSGNKGLAADVERAILPNFAMVLNEGAVRNNHHLSHLASIVGLNNEQLLQVLNGSPLPTLPNLSQTD